MIKIFFVIDSLAIGGAQLQLLELARRLDRRRFEVAVCPLWPIMELEAQYRRAEVRIVEIHKYAHLDISIIWRLARQMRAFQPDIVHTWLTSPNLWGRLAALLARVPVVIASERSAALRNVVPAYAVWLNFLLASQTDLISTNSLANEKMIRLPKIKPPILKVVYNGVDLTRFNIQAAPSWAGEIRQEIGLKPGALALGTIGRLVPAKGLEVLFRAFRLLHDNGQQPKLLIAGGGPLLGNLENLAADLGLRDSIIFLGSRRDIPELLAMFDIFVLSSHYEGFPNVILEAMAMGKPVVATNVGGVPELVIDGETGLLVEPGNPQLLTQAILGLINNPDSAKQMGLAGRQRVESEFTMARMVAETTHIYEELLRQKKIAA